MKWISHDTTLDGKVRGDEPLNRAEPLLVEQKTHDSTPFSRQGSLASCWAWPRAPPAPWGLALGGSAAGCAQLVRGALNTPEATRCGPTVALEATSVRKRGHRMT